MVRGFRRRVARFGAERCATELLVGGDPRRVHVEKRGYDRFVSAYFLDLLSETDMYAVLDLAEECLDPQTGRLLLAGITWGYRRDSMKTAAMTAAWDLMYRFRRKQVGGCRPQRLQPYLEAKGWRIKKVVETMPDGFPWMKSEVVSARPPITNGQ